MVITNKYIAPVNEIWSILENVSDPEVPVLSIIDLGVVREVVQNADGFVICVTPTYTGCPAMDVMKMNIRMTLLEAGFTNITIKEVLSPAWNTGWMSEAGKLKLKAYGIAPPQYQKLTIDAFAAVETVPCPLCNSTDTRLVSQFGSTACKALYQCNECREPFDYFKCH